MSDNLGCVKSVGWNTELLCMGNFACILCWDNIELVLFSWLQFLPKPFFFFLACSEIRLMVAAAGLSHKASSSLLLKLSLVLVLRFRLRSPSDEFILLRLAFFNGSLRDFLGWVFLKAEDMSREESSREVFRLCLPLPGRANTLYCMF